MKRSIRAVTTGSGTEPSSSTALWKARMLNLKLARFPTCSPLPSRLYLDRSHFPSACASYLAALPSTRAIPNRDVFCVADPISSIRSERLLRLFAGTHDREQNKKQQCKKNDRHR